MPRVRHRPPGRRVRVSRAPPASAAVPRSHPSRDEATRASLVHRALSLDLRVLLDRWGNSGPEGDTSPRRPARASVTLPKGVGRSPAGHRPSVGAARWGPANCGSSGHSTGPAGTWDPVCCTPFPASNPARSGKSRPGEGQGLPKATRGSPVSASSAAVTSPSHRLPQKTGRVEGAPCPAPSPLLLARVPAPRSPPPRGLALGVAPAKCARCFLQTHRSAGCVSSRLAMAS